MPIELRLVLAASLTGGFAFFCIVMLGITRVVIKRLLTRKERHGIYWG